MPPLAILGGSPLRKKAWPKWPIHGVEEEHNLRDVLHAKSWWMGEKTIQFEKDYAAFQDAKHGIASANGTVAIEAALLAAGVGFGDEVITTPFTFVATVSSVLKVNALPIFADVDPVTGNLDPDDVERRITPRTRAIVPVHVAGLPVDMDRFAQIARKHKLRLIYDAAHGWGSQWRGKGVGAYGDFNTYSFQASKNITAGEGGIILSCDDALAELARSYINCGRLPRGAWYDHFLVGANLRLCEFASAVLLAQLGRLEAQTLRRERNAAVLTRLMGDIPGLTLVQRDRRVTRRAWHLFLFHYDARAWKGLPRAKFIAALQAEGVPCSRVWPLMNRLGMFQQQPPPKSCPALALTPAKRLPDYPNLRLPNAEKLSDETGVWLFQNMLLGDESDMKDIADAILKVREDLDALLKVDLPEPSAPVPRKARRARR